MATYTDNYNLKKRRRKTSQTLQTSMRTRIKSTPHSRIRRTSMSPAS